MAESVMADLELLAEDAEACFILPLPALRMRAVVRNSAWPRTFDIQVQEHHGYETHRGATVNQWLLCEMSEAVNHIMDLIHAENDD